MRNLSLTLAAFGLALSLLPGDAAAKPKKAKITEIEVDASSTDPKQYFELGLQAATGNNLAQAAELFEKSGECGGGSKAWFNAGLARERMGEPAKAADAYLKAYKQNLEDGVVRAAVVRTLKEAGRANEIEPTLRPYAEAHPGDEGVQIAYMEALVAGERYDEAILAGREVLYTKPDSAGVYRILVGLYTKQGKFELAKFMGDKAVELDPKNPDVSNDLGVVLLQQGDKSRAVLRFKEAREKADALGTKHYEASLNLGLIAVESGDNALALTCFDDALTARPGSRDALVGKAIALRGTGDVTKANAIYDELIAKTPQDRLPYINASAMHHYFTKDFKKAAKYLTDYITVMGTRLAVDDEVHTLLADVKATEAAEIERKRKEAELKKLAEEREARAKAILAEMKSKIGAVREALDKQPKCFSEMDFMQLDAFTQVAAETMNGDDATKQAADFKQLYDAQYGPMFDAAMAACGNAPAASAPAATEPAAPADEPAPPTTEAPAQP